MPPRPGSGLKYSKGAEQSAKRGAEAFHRGVIMADIETSVVISAQIDGLRSGMEAASNSVQAATDAMRTQLAGLGDIAQQAQSQLSATTGQIGSSVGALQAKAADLAGPVSRGIMLSGTPVMAAPAALGRPVLTSAVEETRRLTRDCGTNSCLLTRSSRTTSRSSTFRRYRPAKEHGRV
jgi:hypothetical protein